MLDIDRDACPPQALRMGEGKRTRTVGACEPSGSATQEANHQHRACNLRLAHPRCGARSPCASHPGRSLFASGCEQGVEPIRGSTRRSDGASHITAHAPFSTTADLDDAVRLRVLANASPTDKPQQRDMAKWGSLAGDVGLSARGARVRQGEGRSTRAGGRGRESVRAGLPRRCWLIRALRVRSEDSLWARSCAYLHPRSGRSGMPRSCRLGASSH